MVNRIILEPVEMTRSAPLAHNYTCISLSLSANTLPLLNTPPPSPPSLPPLPSLLPPLPSHPPLPSPSPPLPRFTSQGRLVGHNGAVCALATNQELLMTGSRDRLIKIYEVDSVQAAPEGSPPQTTHSYVSCSLWCKICDSDKNMYV